MRKLLKFIFTVVTIIMLFCMGSLAADKHTLRTQILRMHVVANSNSKTDQNAKLCVKDAVVRYLESNLSDYHDAADARAFVCENLVAIEEIANSALRTVGSNDRAVVKLSTESFSKRVYDTFSLPSGIYDSLRIEIGRGLGRNWWCVVFPALCVPSSADEFESVAVSSGFREDLAGTLANRHEYDVRFYFLDCIGKIENFLNNS